MDHEQTATKTSEPADIERLKELFEYEMTQVRAGFRKELLQLSADKMEDAGKDIPVPELKAVETPACQTAPVTLEYACPDISAEMAGTIPAETEATEICISGIQMPESLQNSRLQAAAEAEPTAPEKPVLSLPAAAGLDAVRQAGVYRSAQDAASISAGLEQELNRNALQGALSALDDHAFAEPAAISLPEKSDVLLVDTAMDRLYVWESAQPAVPEKPDLTVPALNPPRYETTDIQPDMPDAISAPDTGMSRIAGWNPAELPECRTDADKLEVPAAKLQPSLPTLPQPEKIPVSVPESRPLPSAPALKQPEKCEVTMPDMPAKPQVSVPQLNTRPEYISVPAAETVLVQAWQPAVPKTSLQAEPFAPVKAPEMPAPPVITVTNSAGITLPKPSEPVSTAVSATSFDAENCKAAAPVLPAIPGIHMDRQAISGEIIPQNTEFGHIRSDMQQVLTDASRAFAEKDEVLTGFLYTAEG